MFCRESFQAQTRNRCRTLNVRNPTSGLAQTILKATSFEGTFCRFWAIKASPIPMTHLRDALRAIPHHHCFFSSTVRRFGPFPYTISKRDGHCTLARPRFHIYSFTYLYCL